MAEELQISDFDYNLPDELIAQEPCDQRDGARLLVVNRATQSIHHQRIADLPQILRSGDLLVFNNTKVIPARIYGTRAQTGGKWEGLFLTQHTGSGPTFWELMAHTRGYIQPGEWIDLLDRNNQPSRYRLLVLNRTPEKHLLVSVKPDIDPTDLLEQIGHTPLPPYIRKGIEADEDRQRYQTVFAEVSGSVAAPTAGLHFTPELLSRLSQCGIAQAFVTLTVGAGTFAPVKVSKLKDHGMHKEWCQLPMNTADAINQKQGRCIAVGTTTVRTLESAALSLNNSDRLGPWAGLTNLFIRPGFQFQVVDGLLTNFHLPRSTLLILVSTFAGHDLIMRAYAEAIQLRYRFFSYGDAMLIL